MTTIFLVLYFKRSLTETTKLKNFPDFLVNNDTRKQFFLYSDVGTAKQMFGWGRGAGM